MEVTYKPINKLEPYARNSRIHSKDQIKKIAEIIKEFGWTNPILADEQSIVAGHGRLQAAKHLYDQGHTITLPDGKSIPKNTVPVIDCTGWSEDQRRAYIIADNRVAEMSSWDKTLLEEELKEIEMLSLQDLFVEDPDLNSQLIQSADDVRKIEDDIDSEKDHDQTDADYDRTMSDKRETGKLPIVPKYLESYAAFIIVCTNAIDEAFIRQRLKLDQPAKSYKSEKVRIPNIISVEQLRELIS